MKSSGTGRIRIGTIGAIAFSIVACQQVPQSSPAATVSQSNMTTGFSPADLAAAGEPFEALAEQAPSATPKQLGQLTTLAAASYRKVEPTLTPSQRADADRYMVKINAKDQMADRSTIALASVEIYRLLLEAQNRAGDPVIGAGLLDYAGFRYRALADAKNVNWAELSRTTRAAQFEWNKLKPSIASAPHRKRFANSLLAMEASAAKRDRIAAKKSADIELQLVDLLEGQLAAGSK